MAVYPPELMAELREMGYLNTRKPSQPLKVISAARIVNMCEACIKVCQEAGTEYRPLCSKTLQKKWRIWKTERMWLSIDPKGMARPYNFFDQAWGHTWAMIDTGTELPFGG